MYLVLKTKHGYHYLLYNMEQKLVILLVHYLSNLSLQQFKNSGTQYNGLKRRTDNQKNCGS